jgi:2-keto-3-deoxy-L-rhamnonate aldolase RhmA
MHGSLSYRDVLNRLRAAKGSDMAVPFAKLWSPRRLGGSGIADDIVRMTRLAQQRNTAAGVIGTNADDIELRQKQGFRMIGLGSDAGMILRQLGTQLERFKRKKFKNSWF